jgi:hypothetical protein
MPLTKTGRWRTTSAGRDDGSADRSVEGIAEAAAHCSRRRASTDRTSVTQRRATELAQRLYPPLDVVGLAATLRFAAAAADVPASVELDLDVEATYPRVVIETIYLCWLETLEHTGSTGHTAITVRIRANALTFEIAADGHVALEPLRDRAEALGGRLSARPEPEGRTRIVGALPLD